jgi:hypothetical protein
VYHLLDDICLVVALMVVARSQPHSEEAGVDNPTAALGDVSGEFLAVLLKP